MKDTSMQPSRKNYKTTNMAAYPSLLFGFKFTIVMCIIGALTTFLHFVTGAGAATSVVWFIACWPVIFAGYVLFAMLTELGIRFSDGSTYILIAYASQAVGWFAAGAIWHKLIGYKYFGSKKQNIQSSAPQKNT